MVGRLARILTVYTMLGFDLSSAAAKISSGASGIHRTKSSFDVLKVIGGWSSG